MDFLSQKQIFQFKNKRDQKRSLQITKEKDLSTPKIKEIEKIYLNQKKDLSNLKKYYGHDGTEYREIRDVKNLFDLLVDEGYYKPILINDAFNSNYIEHVSKREKDKTLSIKEYLNMIKPYLVDVINNHKR